MVRRGLTTQEDAAHQAIVSLAIGLVLGFLTGLLVAGVCA